MNSLKANLLSFMLVFTLAIFAISCSNPLNNARDSKPSNTTLNLDDAAAVLRAIKLPELVLPKSLQDGTESSGGARHIARAYGDISDLTSMPLPSLKSSRYLELKDTLARGSQSQMFLRLFKDYATNNPMPIGQDFELQTFSFDFGWGYPMEWVKPGKMRIVRTRSDELSYYWSMSYPLDNKAFSNPASELRIPIYLVLIVNNTGKLEMLVYAPDFNGGEFMQMYDSYEPSTNRGITIQNSSGNISYMEFFKSSDGSVQAYSKYYGKNQDGLDNEHNWVAYGNDLYGGYFSSHAGTFIDGGGVEASYKSADVDYYDQNGNLIAQGWGQQEPQTWMSKYGLNIKNVPGAPSNAPETFKIKWIPGTPYKCSISWNGDTWSEPVESGTYDWSAYWSDSDEQNVWNAGDAQYWSSNWLSYDDNGNWVYEVTYDIAYQVPYPMNIFGADYYVVNQYPLKNVLPLSTQYEGKFSLRQKEGHTYIGWLPIGGNNDEWVHGIKLSETQYLDTNEANISGFNYWGLTPEEILQDGRAVMSIPAESETEWGINTWINNEYWLENLAWRNDQGNNDNNPNTCNSNHGDLYLRMYDMSIYYWDQANQRSVQMTTPAVEAPVSLPKYFTLSQSLKDKMTSTRTKIDSIVASYAGLTIENKLAEVNFSSKMPPITDFPK